MKKTIAIVLTLLTIIAVTVGPTGCKDKDKLELPELTAEKPYYERNFSESEWDYKITNTSSELKNFLNTEFRKTHNEKFYMIDFKQNILSFGAHLTNLRGYENDEGMEILFLYEWFYCKIDEKREDEALDNFEFIFPPVEQKLEGELNFEYGKWNHPCFPRYYSNLYIADTCIGTCFFNIFSINTVNGEWLKSFFTENLIYWEGPVG